MTKLEYWKKRCLLAEKLWNLCECELETSDDEWNKSLNEWDQLLSQEKLYEK